MASTNKYGKGFTKSNGEWSNARGLWFDPLTKAITDEQIADCCIYFGSIVEFKCYQVLCAEFNPDLIDCHYRFELIPRTQRNTAIYWKIDFRVNWLATGEEFYIEVKGKESADYKVKLNLFRYRFPSLQLFVVSTVAELVDVIQRVKSEPNLH